MEMYKKFGKLFGNVESVTFCLAFFNYMELFQTDIFICVIHKNIKVIVSLVLLYQYNKLTDSSINLQLYFGIQCMLII